MGYCTFDNQQGADWFTSIGTKGSKGTKIFSLVGKVNNTGLVEVPMGMPLRDIIYKIGGGIRKARNSRRCRPEAPQAESFPRDCLILPVDFDELPKSAP